MFQFRRFPTYAYLIQRTLREYCSRGFPHSEIPGSMDICSSPRLIAACHVLHRLLMPRHSPCALFSLTYHRRNSLHSVSALAKTPYPLLPSPTPSQTRLRWALRRFWGRNSRRTLFLNQSEKMVLSRIMQASQIVEIVIVTLRPSGRCSTIKFAILSYGASLLPYLSLVLHCSVFKVRSPALLKPDRNT